MKLAEPTDFDILETLDERGRNTAQNIAMVLDKNRGYVNTRLPHLANLDLVERVGPAENSGLYELTEKGRVVVVHRDEYGKSKADFEALIEEKLRSNA